MNAVLTLCVLAAPPGADLSGGYDKPAPAPTTARDYPAALAAVDAGRVVYLAVGVDAAPGDHTVRVLAGIAPGRYECRLEDGVRHMRPVATESSPPKEKATGPRNPADPNEDHRCPTCGTHQFVQESQRPDGSHTHRCPSCGTSWSHGGKLGYSGTPQPQTQPRGVQFGGGFQFQLTRPGGGG